jgi:hypothetical protein
VFFLILSYKITSCNKEAMEIVENVSILSQQSNSPPLRIPCPVYPNCDWKSPNLEFHQALDITKLPLDRAGGHGQERVARGRAAVGEDLVVRIPGSHPGGPGSIPGNGITVGEE